MADKRISQLIERTDIANNDVLPIVASGATTTNKVTISTIQDWMQENLDVGVTSVGLSMPSAFTVSNSPITTSGNISVTGAGTTAQYIRGDGSLADFPSSTGGGSSVSYYLNGSVNQGTIGGIAYRELSKSAILGAGTDFTINADGYIASFITDAGDPNLLLIPAGNWNFETYLQASSGGGSPTFYIELYKVSGSTATLIASNSGSPELIAFGTNINPYFSALAVPETTLLLTDRLAIRYYVAHSGRTITLHTENNTLCQIITTFTTGLTALNGLTAQVQNFATGTSGTDFNISSASTTHTFNIPSASGTARGLITTGSQTIAGEKNFTSLLTASGANINTPSNGIGLLLNGRTADNFSSIRFGANTGGGQYNTIQASPSSLIVSSQGNTPIEFHTNVNGGGGVRMTIAGSGGVTFTNGITTTSAVLTSVLQGVNANFSGLIETSDSVRIGTTASVKHSNTGFTLSGFNNIHGNIDGFVVQNQTKGFRINFPSNAGFTHTLPDASGTIALTSDLGAYLPLAGGTLTGALNGTSATLSSNFYVSGGTLTNTGNGVHIFNESNFAQVQLNGATGSLIDFSTSGTDSLARIIYFNSAQTLNLINAGTTALSIASTGAATFSSSVRANAASTIYGATQDAIQTILTLGGQNASAQAKELYFRLAAGGTPAWTLQTASVGTDTDVNIYPNGASGLKIAFGGAATFSSSVTAASLNVGSGTLGRNAFSQSDFRIAAPNDTNILNGIAANSSMTIKSDNYGGGSATPLILQSGANNNQLYLATSGSVGIGTDSPSSKLQVVDSGSVTRVVIDNTGNAVAGAGIFMRTFNGATQVSNATIRVDNGGNFEIYSGTSSDSLRFTLTSDSYFRLASSTGGIQFNGDTAAANALDDYEEGTWTGTLTPVTSGTITVSSVTQPFGYTKIGRQVTITGLAVVQSVSSPVGLRVRLGNLPFTVANSVAARAGGSVVFFDASASYAFTAVNGYVEPNLSYVNINFDTSTLAANDEFAFTFTYIV